MGYDIFCLRDQHNIASYEIEMELMSSGMQDRTNKQLRDAGNYLISREIRDPYTPIAAPFKVKQCYFSRTPRCANLSAVRNIVRKKR